MRAAGAGLVWLQKGGKFSCECLTTRTAWGTCPRARGLANLEKAQVFLSYQMTQRGKKNVSQRGGGIGVTSVFL